MEIEDINTVTVIGTGVMGPDIALAFAMAGYHVNLVDIEQDILDRAAGRISASCRLLAEAGVFDEVKGQTVESRISLTLDWNTAVSSADYITEAVPEIMEIKQKVFKRCDDLCTQDVVIASNTSSMSITEIASKMKYPQRAICTHWIIPPHLSPGVEVAAKGHLPQSEIWLSGFWKKPAKLRWYARIHPDLFTITFSLPWSRPP